MGKGSKSTQQKESANERALADVASAKWNRYKSLYRGVETDFQDEVAKDTSSLLQGRATADIAQAAGNSMGDAIALGRGSANQLGETASNLGGARALGAVSANKTAQGLKDKGQLGALAIGLDMSADAQNGLAQAARASQTEAMGMARAQQIKNDAYSNALGQLAGSAVSSYNEGTGYFTSPKDQAATKAKVSKALGSW